MPAKKQSAPTPRKHTVKFSEDTLKRDAKALTKSSPTKKMPETKTVDLQPLLIKAKLLATRFEGECLSHADHISIVKGKHAFKFKC